jgi:hypothetical protein
LIVAEGTEPDLKSSTKLRIRRDLGVTNMDQQTDTDLGQTDEDILTYDVSDEALEAAAGTERGAYTQLSVSCHKVAYCC